MTAPHVGAHWHILRIDKFGQNAFCLPLKEMVDIES